MGSKPWGGIGGGGPLPIGDIMSSNPSKKKETKLITFPISFPLFNEKKSYQVLVAY